MHTTNVLFHIVWLLSAQPEVGPLAPERLDVRSLLPDRLTEVIESRTADTSEVEWTLSWHGGRDDGLVERYTTRTANGSIFQSNRGDAQGFHWKVFRSHPPADVSADALWEYAVPPEESAGTRISLAHDGQFWELFRAESPLSARLTSPSSVLETQKRPRDMAAAGLAPYWADVFNTEPLGLPERYLAGFDSAEWTEQRSGQIEVVSAEFNGKRLEWQLDSRQGGEPIHAAFYQGGRLVYSSETELAEVDGRWMPVSISFYKGDADAPYKVVDVDKVTFDKPWHEKEITPSDMGMLFGTQVNGDDGMRFWNGTELLSLDEYYELLYVYGVRPDPKIMEMLAKDFGQTVEEYVARIDRISIRFRAKYYEEHGESPWLTVTSKEKDEWDIYVEKFIKKHKFDKPRIKRAKMTLDRAKKLRDVYLQKNKSDIRKAERRQDTKRLAVFEAHTENVFQQVLVRGLKRLAPKKPATKKTDPRP